jgi:hypothetical protein
VGGLSIDAALALGEAEVVAWLEADVPAARVSCATLPLRTLRSALGPSSA